MTRQYINYFEKFCFHWGNAFHFIDQLSGEDVVSISVELSYMDFKTHCFVVYFNPVVLCVVRGR